MWSMYNHKQICILFKTVYSEGFLHLIHNAPEIGWGDSQLNVSKAVLQLQNSVSRQKQDWETPHDVFETACKEFYINPKLDVCAYKANKKCEKYFNPHMDGLARDW